MESFVCFILLLNGGNALNRILSTTWQHPSHPIYYLEELCGEELRLQVSGRNSGGIMKIKQDVNTNYPCSTWLTAPEDYLILVVFKSMNIVNRLLDSQNVTNYVQVFSGNLSADEEEEALSGKIHGGYLYFRKEKHTYSSKPRISIKISAFKGNSSTVKYVSFNFVLSFTVFNISDRGKCFGSERFCCRNNRCIWSHLRCNGYDNCGDQSDEAGCIEVTPVPALKLEDYTAVYLSLTLIIIILMIIIFTRGIYTYRRLTSTEQLETSSSSVPRRSTLTSTASTFDNGGFLPVDDTPPSYEEVMVHEVSRREWERFAQSSTLEIPNATVFP